MVRAADDGQVGLGLAVTKGEWPLWPDFVVVGEGAGELASQVHDDTHVGIILRRHLHDLSLEELDMLVFAEDAGLDHPVVLGNAEPSLPDGGETCGLGTYARGGHQ
jgi:hypothetical protein